MKLTFVSNYINHHQAPLADQLYQNLGYDYCFIQTEPMEEERKNMGWNADYSKRPYVKLLYEQKEECLRLIEESDVVIFGWTGEMKLLKRRMATGKCTLRVSERIYREGQWKAISPRGLMAKYQEHIKYREEPLYMLCAGAYVASDFQLIHAYPEKMLRWGYFPPLKEYEETYLDELKTQFMMENTIYAVKPGDVGPLQIVWAGRMMPLKHPEYVVRVAKKLMDLGYHFHVHMMGGGELEEEIRQQVVALGLSASFTFYGFRSPEEVRELMEKCHIHLFTSNYLEGWGAVVNEGMNSGCVEVVSAQAGAAPYLIKPGVNGLLYHKDSYKDFEKQVLYVFAHWKECQEMGKEAYRTIISYWNAQVAAKRLLTFAEGAMQKKYTVFLDDGPLSVAPIISPRKEK